jgi:hypothetical protein
VTTQSPNPPSPAAQTVVLDKLDFDNAFEFLALFDPDVGSGKVKLYPWQIQDLRKITMAPATSQNPFKYCLCAANGSGKDKYIVAPCALFAIVSQIRCTVIITSSSATQLENQTERYIRTLAQHVNAYAEELLGAPILKINHRKITCTLSGSEILTFATNEEGRAEGYHPIEDGSQLWIIVNEVKNVTTEIFRALRRCTGFTHWLNVSSPGAPVGDFYQSFVTWPNTRQVTIHDCPHLSRAEFEADKKEPGEHSPWFKSKWLAEFAFLEGKYVIPEEKLRRLRNLTLLDKIPWFKQDELRVGGDIALSTSGDESVLSIFRGNKQVKLLHYRIRDAMLLVEAFDKDLRACGVPKNCERIFIDDCGVGRGVIAIMRRMGWSIKEVRNNSTPRNKNRFRNRGAELWYKASRLVEEGAIILLDDETQYKQLVGRQYKETEAGVDKLQLQGKKDAASSSSGSPDRADALVTALADINLDEWLDLAERAPEITTTSRAKTPEEIMQELEDKLEFLDNPRSGKRTFNSLNTLVQRQHRARLTYGKWS